MASFWHTQLTLWHRNYMELSRNNNIITNESFWHTQHIELIDNNIITDEGKELINNTFFCDVTMRINIAIVKICVKSFMDNLDHLNISNDIKCDIRGLAIAKEYHDDDPYYLYERLRSKYKYLFPKKFDLNIDSDVLKNLIHDELVYCNIDKDKIDIVLSYIKHKKQDKHDYV